MTLQARTLANVASMENIKMDLDHPLGKGIERIIVRLINREVGQKDSAQEIENVIRKTLNLNATFGWIREANAYVEHQDLDKNHPFWHHVFKPYAGFDFGDLGKIKLGFGEVDTVSGRVSGPLSEIRFAIRCGVPDTLIVRIKDPVQKARRVTAIILHEIGHAFTHCLYFGRTAVTNLVLMEATSRWQGADEKIRVEILEAIEKNRVIQKVDVQKLSTVKDGAIVFTALLNDHFIDMANELGCDLYSKRGCEALADQFAVRLGYGKDLALGLSEMQDLGAVGVFMSLMGLFRAVTIAGSIISTGGMFLLSPVGVIITALGILAAFRAPEAGEIYDRPTRRLEVIRNELRRMLSLDLSNEDKRSTLAALQEIDIAIKDTSDYPLTRINYVNLVKFIVTWVIPVTRERQRSMAFQKRLEDLMSSKLYETSARLENLV